MQPLNINNVWKRHFGRRFLNIDNFIDFCREVGIYSCTSAELEDYERQGWMYPAARLIMPENYARTFWNSQLTDKESEVSDVDIRHHELEMVLRYPQSGIDTNVSDLRHPIDKAWGVVASLQNPQDQQYQSWDIYSVMISDTSFDTATHFYHYWQVYELYQVRRQHRHMYQDYTPQYPLDLNYGDIVELKPFFEAVSYFQHLYRNRYRQIVGELIFNDDGAVIFDTQQVLEVEQAGHIYSKDTLAIYQFNEDDLYKALRGMLFLYYRYGLSERYKLAEVLKGDIWSMVELIGFAFSASTTGISDRIGYVGPGISSVNSLESLFPNRRKISRQKAANILTSLVREFNKGAVSYSISSLDIDELLDFLEGNDLATFEYALVELNETYFNRTTWFASESYLRLKSLASFPESLMRAVIFHGSDTKLQMALANPRTGMGKINELLFKHTYPAIWTEYNSAGHTAATNVSDFQANVNYLLIALSSHSHENAFIGVNLSLATSVRNFTSHHLTDNPNLLSGQYAHCIRGILNTAFFVWKDAKRRKWV